MTQPRDSSQLGLYEQTGIVNEYDFAPGVCVLPLAEDPPTDPVELRTWSPVVVLRLHAPYRIRRVKYSSEKVNNPPVIPSPVDAGAFVFVSGAVGITNQYNTTFTNFDWTVTSAYTFVENCVSRPQDGLVLGTQPWVWNASQGNYQQFQASSGGIGAIAAAGLDARIGYTMGKVVERKITGEGAISGIGNAIGAVWGYNQASYFPGCFFNTDLVNGGPSGTL